MGNLVCFCIGCYIVVVSRSLYERYLFYGMFYYIIYVEKVDFIMKKSCYNYFVGCIYDVRYIFFFIY